MIASLFAAWGVVAILAGVLIGQSIREADEHELPDAEEPAEAPMYVPREWVA